MDQVWAQQRYDGRHFIDDIFLKKDRELLHYRLLMPDRDKRDSPEWRKVDVIAKDCDSAPAIRTARGDLHVVFRSGHALRLHTFDGDDWSCTKDDLSEPLNLVPLGDPFTEPRSEGFGNRTFSGEWICFLGNVRNSAELQLALTSTLTTPRSYIQWSIPKDPIGGSLEANCRLATNMGMGSVTQIDALIRTGDSISHLRTSYAGRAAEQQMSYTESFGKDPIEAPEVLVNRVNGDIEALLPQYRNLVHYRLPSSGGKWTMKHEFDFTATGPITLFQNVYHKIYYALVPLADRLRVFELRWDDSGAAWRETGSVARDVTSRPAYFVRRNPMNDRLYGTIVVREGSDTIQYYQLDFHTSEWRATAEW